MDASFSRETCAQSTRLDPSPAGTFPTSPPGQTRSAAAFRPCAGGRRRVRLSITLWRLTNTWSGTTRPLPARLRWSRTLRRHRSFWILFTPILPDLQYNQPMRRASAILLLVVLSFPLISPALVVNAGTALPECCRRDGAHRCAMTAAVDVPLPPSGPSVEAARGKCPLFPKGGAIPVSGNVLDLGPSPFFFASLVSRPAAVEQAEARYRISFSRARQKRGPPSLPF